MLSVLRLCPSVRPRLSKSKVELETVLATCVTVLTLPSGSFMFCLLSLALSSTPANNHIYLGPGLGVGEFFNCSV